MDYKDLGILKPKFSQFNSFYFLKGLGPALESRFQFLNPVGFQIWRESLVGKGILFRKPRGHKPNGFFLGPHSLIKGFPLFTPKKGNLGFNLISIGRFKGAIKLFKKGRPWPKGNFHRNFNLRFRPGLSLGREDTRFFVTGA